MTEKSTVQAGEMPVPSGKTWDEIFAEFENEHVEWCKMYRETAQSYIRTLEAENDHLRLSLQNLPEQLRASLSGHKGEAFRIATQITSEILSSFPSHHGE